MRPVLKLSEQINEKNAIHNLLPAFEERKREREGREKRIARRCCELLSNCYCISSSNGLLLVDTFLNLNVSLNSVS